MNSRKLFALIQWLLSNRLEDIYSGISTADPIVPAPPLPHQESSPEGDKNCLSVYPQTRHPRILTPIRYACRFPSPRNFSPGHESLN